MYILLVHIKVKPEEIESFKAATRENASNSLKEPGVVRFDCIQEIEDPTHFALVEVYRTKEDSALHKQTAHYDRWRETTEPLMSEPRTRQFYENVYPENEGWG